MFICYNNVKKGGGALVHVYVWEHRVSLNYRIDWWIFTKLSRDKVLMTPAHLYWLLDQIRPGFDPGHNRSMWGPPLKGHPQSWKATATNRKHSNDLKALRKMYCFWHVLVSCIELIHFHLFSFKYFNGARWLICINLCTFHVQKNSARLQWYSCARYKAPLPLRGSVKNKWELLYIRQTITSMGPFCLNI